MIKARFIIDGDFYNALFLDEISLCDFVRDNALEGSDIETVSVDYVMPVEILYSTEFEYSYRIEMFCNALYPVEAHMCTKWEQQEKLLKEKGWL